MSDYSSNFPQQRPTLNLDFANSGKLDSRISYSRSSGGTYLSNEKALSSENLLKNSQDYSSVWANQYIAAPAGSQTAPDGSSTAFKLTSSSEASAAPTIYQAGINLAATTHTAVVHLKAGTASHGFISIRTTSGNSAYAMVNFSAGTVSNGHFGTTTNSSSTVTALGSNWFKVTLTATTVAATNGFVFIGSSDGTVPTSSGYPMWTTSGETIYVWGTQLSTVGNTVYDSPTTTQIAREYAPLLKTASADAPRLEYAADGQSVAKGLLIEAQATNLQRYGSDFASWDEPRYTAITSNAGIAPNGLLEADLAVPDSSANYHYVYDTAAVIANATTYTGSVYVKKAGHRYIQITASTTNFGSSQYATFDLDDGSIDANNVTASAESVGNGWWRIQATMTSISAGTGGLAITFANTATGPIFPTISGNDFDGVLCWGWQLETGAVASSLANSGTSSSGVTRAADSCSVLLSDVGIASGQDLTLVVEGDYGDPAIDSNDRIAATLGKDSSNWVYVANRSGKAGGYIAREGGTNQADNTGTVTTGAFKSAVRVAPNNYGQAINGGSAVTDTSGSVPLYDTLSIGKYWNQAYELNGTISRVSIYSEPLSDANLTALTS